jgi:hypothetical protein
MKSQMAFILAISVALGTLPLTTAAFRHRNRGGVACTAWRGRTWTRMPMPPDVGAAVVACLRDSRPTSSCRRLSLRTLAPHVGFASGCAITMIAKTALERAGVRGYAQLGGKAVSEDMGPVVA